MRDELIRVHNDNDRLEERLSALEADQVARARQSARAEPSTHATHPQLKVVRLEPEAEGEAVDPVASAPVVPPPDPAMGKDSESGPRPMIKGSGQKVYSTQGGTTASPKAGSSNEGVVRPAADRGGS
jgi:hypothetical protein